MEQAPDLCKVATIQTDKDFGRLKASILLLMILLLAGGLRWVFAVGPAGSDDMRYMKAAASVARAEAPATLDHAAARAAFIVWLALWVRLGAGVEQLVISDLVLSLAILLVVYKLAVRWSSRRVALLAALWLAFFPLELLCSGLVVPDHLGVLLGLLAASLAYDAMTEQTRSAGGKLLLAGACTGLAVSTKEIYAILPVVIGLWAVSTIRPLSKAVLQSILLGAVSLVVFSLEFPFFYWWTGDGAYRFHSLAEVYTPDRAAQYIGVGELLFYPLQLLGNFGVCGVFGWVMLAGVLGSLRKLTDRRMVLFWSAGFFLFMQYGSFSLESYALLPQQWRYMLPIVVLLFIPIGQWALDLWRSGGVSRFSVAALTAGILCSGVLAANERAAEGLYGEQALRCLTVVRGQEADSAAHVVLPDWLARATALNLRSEIEGYRTVELADGLQADELALLMEEGRVLLAPQIMWRLKERDPNYVDLRRQLECHAAAEPIEDWRSPLDRLASRIPRLRSLARKSVIGWYYRLGPSFRTDCVQGSDSRFEISICSVETLSVRRAKGS